LVSYDGERGGADEWKKQARFEPSRWVTGTIDWLGKRRGRWWVDDLKTGAWPVGVEDNKQLLSYVIVPWLMDGKPDEWECDVSITQWGKYPLAALPRRTAGLVTGFEVQEHLQDLRWALSNPQIVKPSPYGTEELPNCAGCPCREPVPGVSEWLTNFWHRTLPYCMPGIMKVINGDRVQVSR